MSQAVAETAAVLPYAFDFGRFTKVTNVGGGDGTLLAAVLDAHPGLTGVVLDTERGLAEAPRTLERHGIGERCSLIAGDFFRSVPEGSDLYLMKSILHDWTDDQAVTILTRCREVLSAGGLVLIVEPVLPEVSAIDTRADFPGSDLLRGYPRLQPREETRRLRSRASNLSADGPGLRGR